MLGIRQTYGEPNVPIGIYICITFHNITVQCTYILLFTHINRHNLPRMYCSSVGNECIGAPILMKMENPDQQCGTILTDMTNVYYVSKYFAIVGKTMGRAVILNNSTNMAVTYFFLYPNSNYFLEFGS